MANWVGKRLGKVQIEALVARGGVAEVYVGTHIGLERKVAVKLLRSLHADSEDALARFQREARVIARLRHPNIVQVHDFDTIENDPYLVMEYIEGPSLSQYLKALHKNNERLRTLHVIRLMNAIASALQYAHNHGVIHRDIKPGNILLTSPTRPIEIGRPLPDDFEPVLTDFGLVRFLDGNRETTTGHIAGTPAYMSPEQARGEATDARTDVYSLGIVLYELLAGYVPFDGETTVSILLKQVNEPPPPIPGISPAIADVLHRALAKNKEERFATPMEFVDTFRLALEASSDRATVQTSVLPETTPPWKPNLPAKSDLQPRLARIAILGLIALGLGAFLFMSGLPASRAQNDVPTLPSRTDTILPVTGTVTPTTTATATPPVFLPLGPPGILRFQNGSALVDQAVLIAKAMPMAPEGSQYEVWLANNTERISLGVFSPDETGQGELTFSIPEASNLLARYDRVEITVEPNPDTNPRQSNFVAYAFTLPSAALTHLRYLLAEFPNTPDRTGLIQGMYTDIQEIYLLTQEMQAAYDAGQRASMQQKAEAALNILVGSDNKAEYKDWNGDGSTDGGERYGLLLNGSNFGYIQAAYAETDYTVSAAGATQYMISNGDVVKACVQDLAVWVPQLREELLTILTSSPEEDISEAILDSVALAGQMLNGMDLDANGQTDAVAGECGAQIAYEYAYYMADMPLLVVNAAFELTIAANASQIAVLPTRTRAPSQNNPNPTQTSQSVVSTPAGNDTNNPPPADTPKPKNTKKPDEPNPTDPAPSDPNPNGNPTKKPKKD